MAGIGMSFEWRDDTMNHVMNILLIMLAVIGAIVLIGVLGMWLMHGMMMGPGTMGSGIGIIVALVLLGVAAVMLLLRTKPSP